jgi:2-keto-4-pentenoate hydratase/2-oxohepta-3-ene-1,7-dioic acid hydratase in catechol pathway
MKLVLFTRDGSSPPPTAGLLTDRGVVPLPGYSSLEAVIDRFASVRPDLERQAETATPLTLQEVQLQPPLPRPGKILCSTNGFGGSEPGSDRAPLLFTLKSAESVIGPGQRVQLPDVGNEWQFVAEAELGLVIRGPARSVKAANWRDAVFGYTCVIDVMARGDTTFGRDFWLAKSDTLGPLGPCIVTADAIGDPNALRVRSLVNGEAGQDYTIAEAEYSIGELIELATTIMTLNTGDVLACGTSREGLRPLRNADEVRVDIEAVGQLDVRVAARAGVHA